MTIVSGLAAAARKGILVKGGVYLEGGYKLDYLALDKTGTITHGKPVQTDYVALDPSLETTAPALAASLAARSDHPVSRAIANAAVDKQLTQQVVDNFEALAGRGVRGDIGGQTYHLGNHRLVEDLGLCSPNWKRNSSPWKTRQVRGAAARRYRPLGAVCRGRHRERLQP